MAKGTYKHGIHTNEGAWKVYDEGWCQVLVCTSAIWGLPIFLNSLSMSG